MSAALWGTMTALGWGGADFIARFTGRALGHRLALFAILSVSALLLSLFVWLAETPLVWHQQGLWLLLLTGSGIMLATLLLYWGLARGPVTVVSPIVASYPALNVLLALVLGVRPSALEWAAILGVMLGVVIVAQAAGSFEATGGYSRAELRKTVVISLGSAVCFAIAIAAAQQAALTFGELQTVLYARWISLASLGLLLLWRREIPRIPHRWWPLLALQGLMDSLGYICLLYGSGGEDAVIAVVVSSGFGAVTVILARLFLREAMTWPQWGGIALIVTGVATLSAH